MLPWAGPLQLSTSSATPSPPEPQQMWARTRKDAALGSRERQRGGELRPWREMLILTFTLQAEAQSPDPEAGRGSSFHQVPPIILVLKHPGPGAAALCLPALSPSCQRFFLTSLAS